MDARSKGFPDPGGPERVIRTPDRRLRVFVSSTLVELAEERRAVRAAIESLRLTPVMFEMGARPYPPRDLYRAYLEQCDVFVGVYGSSYGWVAPDMDISGLEDEYRRSQDMPRLMYAKLAGDTLDPRLESMLIETSGDEASFRSFSEAQELGELVRNDLALLLSERFELSAKQRSSDAGESREAPARLVSMLFASLEGPVRLRQDSPELADACDRLLRDAVRTHEGRVLPALDEAFVAVFPSARAAVETAIAIGLESREAAHDREPLSVRMAVHSGDVEESDGGLTGSALGQCGRLLEAAHGGQVLISATTEPMLAEHLPQGVSLTDLGEHRLRDLSRPQRVFQVCHPALEAAFPPLRSLGGSSNLPVQLTSFVGRTRESADVADMVRSSRLVTVVGTGGCGKSRLAVQVAARMSDEFRDGPCLVELAPVTDPDLVASSVASALGVRQQPGRELTEALAGFLRSRTLLLVIDNCEHLVEAVAALVGYLLAHTPDVRVLATSREPMHVRGETVFGLSPMPVAAPGDEWHDLVSSDGVQLFAERATAANPRFRLTPDNGGLVASICARLDGIPLALELAASASRLLALDQIAARLDDRFHLLTGGARDVIDHHRTLEAAIDWSYGLLTPEQAEVFERLSVFAGTFSLEAAEAVCADEDKPSQSILENVVELADRSLLEIEETERGIGYRLLETIRVFASARLELRTGGEGERLREQHCCYFLSLAERVTEGPISADAPPGWLTELDAASADLHQALAWAVESQRDQLAVDLAGALGWYWHLRRHHTEAIHWLRAVPLDSSDIAIRSRIRALRFAAHHLTNALTGGADDFPTARRLTQESLDLARGTDDPDLIAASLHQLGINHVLSGDPQAVPVLEEGMAVAHQAGSTWREVLIRNMLAHHYHQAGQLGDDDPSTLTAIALWEENLRAARLIGDDRTVALTLGFLSPPARSHDLDKACRLAQESLAIGRILDDHAVLNNALQFLGEASYLKGDLESARAAYQEEAELSWRTLGEDDETVHMALGMIDYVEGDLVSAREHLGRALALMDASPASIARMRDLRRALWGLGRVFAREHAEREAAVLFAAVESAPDDRPPWVDDLDGDADHRACVELIHAALAPEVLAQAQRRGASLTLAEAVDYALALLKGPTSA